MKAMKWFDTLDTFIEAFNDATHWMLSIGREEARLFRRHELATELQQVLSSVRNANLQLTS